MNKFLRKLQYKQEFKAIKPKIKFLLEQAQLGTATNSDVAFWQLYIERLEELKDNNISGANDFLLFTIEMYDKYIKKLEEI